MKQFKIIVAITIVSTFLVLPTNTLLAQTSTDSSSIRQKVQEKVEEVLKNPKAYMGQVTDVSETTIQIKPEVGVVKQISIDENIVTTINAVSSTPRTVSINDIAIGDFVVAMGYKDGNEILDARRILISTSPAKPARKSYSGVVSAKTGNTGKFRTVKDNQEIAFGLNQQTRILKIVDEETETATSSELKEGDRIIISGVVGQNTFTARRILITYPSN